MSFIKKGLSSVVSFTTGLGFYGLGLLVVAALLTVFTGWGFVPAGLIGAFVYRNFEAIVSYFNYKEEDKEL